MSDYSRGSESDDANSARISEPYHSDRSRIDDIGSYDHHYKTNVEEAIKASIDTKYEGTFAHAESMNAAPNPGLEVEGYGPIPLPLVPASARALIGVCEQAPFGQGERTVVDKEVRDTWQVNAEKVRFTNPCWGDFIQKSIENVCATLGVVVDDTEFKYELHKLLIYEEGSHFLPHVDSEKQTGMFATMVVILPSLFEGGAVHLTHGNGDKVIDVGGPLSTFQTTVLAWYTDIMHEVKPITSGYRLALSYNLIRSGSGSLPAPLVAPTRDASTTMLTEALSHWLEGTARGESVPKKLAWLLQHKYSRMNMRASALKGPDMHLVRRLRPIAKELGLELGLAIVSTKVMNGYPDEEDHYDPSEKWMKGDNRMKFLVDLEGCVVCDAPRFSRGLAGEMMPDGWRKRMFDSKLSLREYEGYTGNEAGTVFHWYRRTALVIWPKGTEP